MATLSLDPLLNMRVVKEVANKIIKNPVVNKLSVCQAILESRLIGKPSTLAFKYNNLFGITEKNGTAGRVNMPTKEYINGRMVDQNRYFSVNKTLEDSFTQYIKIMDLDRYAPVRNARNVEEAAIAVQKGGWATDPSYSQQLITIYNQYVR